MNVADRIVGALEALAGRGAQSPRRTPRARIIRLGRPAPAPTHRFGHGAEGLMLVCLQCQGRTPQREIEPDRYCVNCRTQHEPDLEERRG